MKTNIAELLKFFNEKFPYLTEDMKCTKHEQDHPGAFNPYHMEGTVYAHTVMVLKEAESYSNVVKISALLHDIGKTKTREFDEETGKVSFKGHESKSTFMAVDILDKFIEANYIDKKDKEQVLKIINFHGDIFNHVKDGKVFKPEKIINKFKNLKEYQEFINFCSCDALGRISLFNKRENVKELFTDKLYENLVDKTEHRVENTITILIGLPGSAKSTSIKNKDISVVSRDDILMKYCDDNSIKGSYNERFKQLSKEQHQEIDASLLQRFNYLKKAQKDIIIDMTNLSKKSRRKFIAQIPNTYKKEAVVFLPGKSLIKKFNSTRTDKVIPEHVYDFMEKTLSLPDYNEFDSIKYLFKENILKRD